MGVVVAVGDKDIREKYCCPNLQQQRSGMDELAKHQKQNKAGSSLSLSLSLCLSLPPPLLLSLSLSLSLFLSLYVSPLPFRSYP